MTDHIQEPVAALIAEGERQGCLNLSRFNEFVAEHELEDDDVENVDDVSSRDDGRVEAENVERLR